MGKIRVGDKAPDFSLTNQNGETVSLGDFLGKKNLVLYFYPKDDTPGCTAESCTFRDSYEDFTGVGAEVVGVSSDSESSHKRFAEKHRLPFTLLSDRGGKLREKFGVPKTFGLLPGRVTYVIDKQGVVRHVFNSQLNARAHVDEARKILAQLS